LGNTPLTFKGRAERGSPDVAGSVQLPVQANGQVVDEMSIL
jgi:hypothetical protein